MGMKVNINAVDTAQQIVDTAVDMQNYMTIQAIHRKQPKMTAYNS